MSELLSMPIPFASSLVVLAMVAAFFFIKFLVLALSLDNENRTEPATPGNFTPSDHPGDRRMRQSMRRRATDYGHRGSIVHS